MSDASLVAQLAARIDALELQTRRLKRLFLASAVAALCLGTVATGFAAQRALTFTDSNGSVRINSNGFTLFDAKGHKRLTLGFNKAHQPGMYVWDENGIDRLGAYLSDKDQPVFRLTDARHVDRAFFGLTESEKPRIEFNDHTSTRRLYVGLTSEDDGLVRTFSTEGKEEIGIGNQFIRIGDGSGTERAYIGLSENDTSIVKLWDKNHTERNFMGEYNDGTSGVSSFSSSGTATWTSP